MLVKLSPVLKLISGDNFEPVAGEGNGVLRMRGNLVIKLLEGNGYQELRRAVSPCFSKVYNFRPKATRQESREIYLVGLGRLDPSR